MLRDVKTPIKQIDDIAFTPIAVLGDILDFLGLDVLFKTIGNQCRIAGHRVLTVAADVTVASVFYVQ